jgi:hypothetical protein
MPEIKFNPPWEGPPIKVYPTEYAKYEKSLALRLLGALRPLEYERQGYTRLLEASKGLEEALHRFLNEIEIVRQIPIR